MRTFNTDPSHGCAQESERRGGRMVVASIAISVYWRSGIEQHSLYKLFLKFWVEQTWIIVHFILRRESNVPICKHQRGLFAGVAEGDALPATLWVVRIQLRASAFAICVDSPITQKDCGAGFRKFIHGQCSCGLIAIQSNIV